MGEPLLREESVKVVNYTDELMEMLDEMFVLMDKANGIGLAAVQVGELTRVFVTHLDKDKPRIFINPEIIQTSMEEDDFEEGCLSIPGINSNVTRPYGITIQAWNEKERPFRITVDGLLARVIQHELDHLNGKLFIDHVDPKQREKLIDLYNRKK